MFLISLLVRFFRHYLGPYLFGQQQQKRIDKCCIDSSSNKRTSTADCTSSNNPHLYTMPDLERMEQFFNTSYAEEKSSAIATLKTLIHFLEQEDKSCTAQELSKNVRSAIEHLKLLDCRTEVESVGEIYFRFITLNSGKFEGSIVALKEELSRRSQLYMNKVINSRKDLAKNGQKFITDGCTILVHSMSRAVLQTLKEAKAANKHFQVYVTESAPDFLGRSMHELLEKEGLNSTLILDSAMGYIMERIDLVLVGAEGVAESGGIINKIGTYQLAICAKAHNKPFYVLVESYKFIRLYPLSQAEIPDRLKWRSNSNKSPNSDHTSHPLVDYTPPNYITLLLTDLGTLTTPAVCDTLLQLYT